MAKQTPSQKTEHSFVEEAFGLLLIFITLLLFVSLFSFDPSDPSLNHAVTKKEVHNLGGLFGAYLAGFLNDFFGTASLLLPLSITGIGAVCIFHLTVPWWRWLGCTSLSLCILVFCYALDISLFGLTNGGIVGLLLGQLSSKLLSPFGSSLFWIFASAFSLQLFIGFSWTEFFHSLSEISSSFVRDIKERKEKKEDAGESSGGKEGKRRIGLFFSKTFSFLQHSKKDALSETEEKKTPRKKKVKKRKPVAEEDMPFAGNDDLGIPFDSSFAQGYPPLHTKEEQEQENESPEPVEQSQQKESKAAPSAEQGSLLPLLGNEPEKAAESEPQKTASQKITPKKGASLQFPPLDLLLPQNEKVKLSEENIRERGVALMNCLKDFSIQGELVGTASGPVVTTYMVRPAAGVSVRLFSRHGDDIALSLKARSVFIQAPVPETDTVGVIIPNPIREIVNFREIAENEVFKDADSMALPLIIGKDTIGKPYIADLARMPHLLIAGATGQGKSVCLNTILTSLLLRKLPSELKIVLVDPKRVEMGMYEDESHLIHPVVKEISDAKNALQWAVQEMDERYEQMARLYTKNIFGYNAKIAAFHGNPPEEFADLKPMPFIVIIIDELADLMLQARKDVEPCIIRLAQLARACGIHMILATQRPSVDVVTGLIKANFPCRICFTVSSRQDSVTTLGTSGAEKLLGAGDMFYNPNGGQLIRLHGPYLKDEEVQAVVEFWKQQQAPNYEVDFSSWSKETSAEGLGSFSQSGVDSSDPMYQEVLEFIKENKTVSVSLLQRRFNIGFNKAARYMDRLDKEGFVGPAPGAGKPRPVIMH